MVMVVVSVFGSTLHTVPGSLFWRVISHVVVPVGWNSESVFVGSSEYSVFSVFVLVSQPFIPSSQIAVPSGAPVFSVFVFV